MFLLAVDTCGPSGSVALGRFDGSSRPEILAEITLEGRTYSATLVSAVADLLTGQGIRVPGLGCIVVVHGPGSFTGVRVGLSAVKGLAEGAGLSVVPLSRLAILAHKAGVSSAALDARRDEVFLRLAHGNGPAVELLAGAADLSRVPPSANIAVCDPAAQALLHRVWPSCRQIHVPEPSAADAMLISSPEIEAGRFADLALLDGHYLRRSDAEIFGHTVFTS